MKRIWKYWICAVLIHFKNRSNQNKKKKEKKEILFRACHKQKNKEPAFTWALFNLRIAIWSHALRGNVLILFSACNRPTGCDFTTKTSNTFLARFTVWYYTGIKMTRCKWSWRTESWSKLDKKRFDMTHPSHPSNTINGITFVHNVLNVPYMDTYDHKILTQRKIMDMMQQKSPNWIQ